MSDALFTYYRRPSFIPADAFLLDTHTHTIASDGWMTPRQLIRWELANGFNAFVLSDHNTHQNNTPILALQSEFPEITIIPGYEWTTLRIHMNLIGIKQFEKPTSMNPTDEEIQHVIQKVHALGGLVQVNHITWTLDQSYHRSGEIVHPTRQQLLDWGVDGFEINNEMRWYDPKTKHLIESLRETHALIKPIFLSTGTDIHNPIKEYATGWTQLHFDSNLPDSKSNLPDSESKILPARSWPEIKHALSTGTTTIWVDHDFRYSHESATSHHPHRERWNRWIFAACFAVQTSLQEHPGGLRGAIITLITWACSYFPLRAFFYLLFSLFS